MLSISDILKAEADKKTANKPASDIKRKERGFRRKVMGKFVIRTTNTGVKFDLKATNGQVIATSQVYKSLKTCMNGVNSVIKNAAAAAVENQTVEGYETLKHPKFEVYKDKAEQFRFRLKAKNGQIIAVSEDYTTLRKCLNGVASVQKNAPDAKIEEA